MAFFDEDQVKSRLSDALMRWGATGKHLVSEAREIIQAEVREMAREGLFDPPDYLTAFVRRSPLEPTRLDLSVIRDPKKYPFSEADYNEWFGQAPKGDDLDRLNCQQTGDHGHTCCGYCPWCDRQMWQCKCDPPTWKDRR